MYGRRHSKLFINWHVSGNTLYKKVNFFSIELFFPHLLIFTLLIWFSFKNTKTSDDMLLTFKSCRSKLFSWDGLSWFKVLQSKVSYFKPSANKFSDEIPSFKIFSWYFNGYLPVVFSFRTPSNPKFQHFLV